MNAWNFVRATLFTKEAQHRLMKEIAPRYKKEGVLGNYVRIKYMGARHPDAAHMAMIELKGNPIDIWEKRQLE